MYQLEQAKTNLVYQLRTLCALCNEGRAHNCPLTQIEQQVMSIKGTPLIVNNKFYGMLNPKLT